MHATVAYLGSPFILVMVWLGAGLVLLLLGAEVSK